jgi:serine/threonine protein kinase
MLALRVMTATTNGGHAADDATVDLIGTTFAGREVDSVIGGDLVSAVYRATEHDDGRVVALRLVAEDLCDINSADREPYERFQRRACAALTFNHPNAPSIDEVGEYCGRGYVVSSHVDTISFGSYIHEHGPLRIETALALFEQIADVLDAGHRAGLTHGAVSPSTLRIATPLEADRPPTAYLTGYGLVELLELRLRRDRNHLNVVDDLLYLAPEQLRRDRTTGRTDQYAMACALVHALTGAPPFVRYSVGGLFGAHLFVAPAYDAALPPSRAIVKALSKQPRDRYATCGQLIADIERAQRSAANRRNMAARRQRFATENGGREDHAGDQVRATTAAQSLVVDLDTPDAVANRHSDARIKSVGDARARVIIVDLSAGPDGGAVAHASDAAAIVDKSPPGPQPASTMANADLKKESASGQRLEGAEDDLNDVPVSEVLSRRPHGSQGTAWGRRGALVALVLAVLVAAVVALWLMGS